MTGKPPYPALTFSTLSIGRPLLAEVRRDDAWLARDGLGLAFHQHSAVVENDEAVDEAHHGLHGVLDNDDGDALLRQRADEADELVGLAMAKAGQRLIEQQKTRLT